MSETETQPNTKHVSVPLEVPRDPEQYRATTHFSQRLRDRLPDRDWDYAIGETIRRGELRGASPPVDVDDSEVCQSFSFQLKEIELVVGIRPVAFTDPGELHLALTIYEVDDES